MTPDTRERLNLFLADAAGATITIRGALEDVLRREGAGLERDPRDPGGPTHRGITLRFAREVLGDDFGLDDLTVLTSAEAFALLFHVYVRRYRLDELPHAAVLELVLDYAVHSGPRTAIAALQHVVAARPDGIIGPETIHAVRVAEPRTVVNALAAERTRRLARLVQNDINRFLTRWTTLKRRHPDVVAEVFEPGDELDVAAYNAGWIARAQSFIL